MKHSILIISVLGAFVACKTPQATVQTTPTPTRVTHIAEKSIPCLYMRAGTSKGPFLDMRDLPSDVTERNKILLKIMGSPDPHQIDGLGGTVTVTSKAVMVQPSKRKGIDVDYLFAQIEIEKAFVDTTPPCGNMMAGVGPFAIERGMVKATIPETRVMVYNINTHSIIEEVVQTPKGYVEYEGTMAISGVPGTAAPVVLNLFDQVGGKTGKLLPTGRIRDTIQGVAVSLVDAGIPMVLMKATDWGLVGNESGEFFQKNKDLMAKLEKIRLEAGQKMGLGDVSNSVLPKIGLLSQPKSDSNNIQSLYFTPKTLHPAHAVTGAICVGTALKIKGSVASDVGKTNGSPTEVIVVEHPSGVIEVKLEMENIGDKINVKRAGTIRTVRKIMEGAVFH
jgi:2-methylaconitate cis-trans-isomerase PrpF